jgi:hypothetical protein
MYALARRLRRHRNESAFDRAMRNASPTMQQELMAAASRSIIR